MGCGQGVGDLQEVNSSEPASQYARLHQPPNILGPIQRHVRAHLQQPHGVTSFLLEVDGFLEREEGSQCRCQLFRRREGGQGSKGAPNSVKLQNAECLLPKGVPLVIDVDARGAYL